LEVPWLPDSPAPVRTYGAAVDQAGADGDFDTKQGSSSNSNSMRGSPSRSSARPSARFTGASSRRRNSTRLHLFPEHAASREIRDVLLALAGNVTEEEAQVDTGLGKKRDLAYMEQVDEDEELGVAIEEKILEAANSPIKVSGRSKPRPPSSPFPLRPTLVLFIHTRLYGIALTCLIRMIAPPNAASIVCDPAAGQEDLEGAEDELGTKDKEECTHGRRRPGGTRGGKGRGCSCQPGESPDLDSGKEF